MEMWLFALVNTSIGFVGNWLCGNKKWYGSFIVCIGLVGWIVYDILNNQWPLVFFPTAINLVIQARNMVKWHGEARTAARQAFRS
jgi:hypothetical protein